MIARDCLEKGASTIADAVRTGQCSAEDVARQALEVIARKNQEVNAVTRVFEHRALAEAAAVDQAIAQGRDPGILAGVPYAVKDLFDVAGFATTAGAARLALAQPAQKDAVAIQRLQAAGAVLVASCNMDEFAYGFVTDNAHWGITRNPHDPKRFAGGSSGGSAAAVASGMVAFTLGSDTNGSIRIPASLCGVFGNKPTHGSLPLEGVYPFVHTLDDIGILARSAMDLRLIDGVVRAKPVVVEPVDALRIGTLGGWFSQNLAPEMEAALNALRQALGGPPVVQLQDVARARSAAYLITAYEGGRLHRENLCRDPLSYDPATRDRLLVGAVVPDGIYRAAMHYRAEFAAQFDRIFAQFDVLIAPATYGPAPLIDNPVVPIDGHMQSARANLGLYTQPISYLGLPVVTAPLAVSGLPMGVQLIGLKGSDGLLMAFANNLEAKSLATAQWSKG